MRNMIGYLIFLRKFKQAPETYPRYPKIRKWLRVWGMFKGYVGVFLEYYSMSGFRLREEEYSVYPAPRTVLKSS